MKIKIFVCLFDISNRKDESGYNSKTLKHFGFEQLAYNYHTSIHYL